jgi:RimK family alpha-L-glutamate ligase
VKIGILASDPTGWHVQRLLHALQRCGATVGHYNSTRLVTRVGARPRATSEGESLDDCAALVVRGIPIASLEQIIFRVDALHRMENQGLRVINSAASIEKTVDKYYTSSLLEDAGLPTPRTIVTECFDQAVAAFVELGGDVVLKPLFGSEGKGMIRLNDADLAHRVFRTLEQSRYVFYLQEFVPHDGWDIRAFILGDQVLASMARRGAGWKTNVAQGARTEALTLDPALADIALRAARLAGCDYAGVDILCDPQGQPFVLEVNSIPGWHGLQTTVTFDVADEIAAYILGVLDP